MSIPTLCQACYTHSRSTVVTACPCCDDVQFPEQMLCDLVREGQSWSRLHGNVCTTYSIVTSLDSVAKA